LDRDGIQVTESADIKLGAVSLKDFINKIEQRMALLTPNPELEKELLSTNPYILVECSPWDKIWGNGIDLMDVDAWSDVSKWKGQNLLGEVLMEVRNDLKFRQ
jgi:ribA/ribD-fused uncharacterized protein